MLRIARCALAFSLLAGCGALTTTPPDAATVKETNCINGADDDGDGKIDCDDDDCAADSACRPPEPKPCSRQNPDCADVVQETVGNVCLEKKCVAPGSHDRKGGASTVTVNLDFTFASEYANAPASAKPQSVVIRVLLPQKLDGTRLTCADVLALSGRTESTRSQLDTNADLNQTFRNLWPMNWSGVGGAGQVVFPNNSAYRIARGKPFILYGEAWFGSRELQNPTGNRAATDCKEGVDLEAATEGQHFGLSFPKP